jgi:hypothetical protein
MAGQPAAFMSYARFDDQHADGQLTAFRERLAAEVFAAAASATIRMAPATSSDKAAAVLTLRCMPGTSAIGASNQGSG